MEIATLVGVLDQPHVAADHLQGWGVGDVGQAQRTLVEIADSGLSLDLLAGICRQLAQHLPQMPDPDAALEGFRRYLFAVRSPLALAALLARDRSAMPMLLPALSLGPRQTNLLVDDPEAFDLLRQSEGEPIARDALLGDILAEIASLDDERSIVGSLTRNRARHTLRIAYGEVFGHQLLEVVTEQLSSLAEALVAAAFDAAQRRVTEGRSTLHRADTGRVRSAVIALGLLGGEEMDYSAGLELLVVYDGGKEGDSGISALHEHFDRVARLAARLLHETAMGESAAEIGLMSLPDSPRVSAAHAVDDVLAGFDSFGRTWHRQAMLKARTVAGDRELGEGLLRRLDSWLYRRYLSRADEMGIKALKRRIVMEATLHQDDWRDPRLARGGLRDLESMVGLLQLLTGGDQPAARQRGTLAAIVGLAQAGAISPDERRVLEDSYRYLRQLLHRLQIVVEPGATEMPADDTAVERMAANLGQPLDSGAFREALKTRLSQTWQTLRKLLDAAFPEEATTPREVELLLDPAPAAEEVRAALAPFGFAQPVESLVALNHLAAEQVPFLSTRRCRYLLASILPRLLCEIAATPNPDRTLADLARVSDSLGGKGVLWDLFRFNPPSLQLYVRLCAASPYLSDILTTNPGMIDELVDSLQLADLPTRQELDATLTELCRGAVDNLSVLHDFKNAQHLRIGVRDILAKDDIDRTHEALADVAEVCMAHVAQVEFEKLVEKFGMPTVGPGPREGQPCRPVIVALGKLGGREPNYHSHIDVLMLYEAEGTTRPAARSRRDQRTANNHFFTQLAQRLFKEVSQLTPKGRLYSIDASLRPIGVGGSLALSLTDFQQHFAGGAAPLWQWQMLCQARPIFGDAEVQEATGRLMRELIATRPPRDDDRDEIVRSRQRLEGGASLRNLKRGPGGTLDVEYLVQMLQLQHSASHSAVLIQNTQAALVALAEAGVLTSEMALQLGNAYRFLRRIESGLRLLDLPARHELPSDPEQLGQLALLLGHSNPQRLSEQCLALMAETRAAFEQCLMSQTPTA